MENKSKVRKKYPTYMTISNKYRFLQPSKQLQLKLAVTNFDTRNLLDIKFHFKFPFDHFTVKLLLITNSMDIKK